MKTLSALPAAAFLTFALSLALSLAIASGAAAETITLLAHHDRAFAGWDAALNSAQSTIDLVTYEFDPCSQVGRHMRGVFISRAQHGVRVRILIDGYVMPQSQQRSLAADLRKYGIEVRYFNSSSGLLWPSVNMRLHAKFALIDSNTLLTGSRNFNDSHFGMSHHHNYIDRDVIVRGHLAAMAKPLFADYWNTRLTAPAGSPSQAEFARYATCATPIASDLTLTRALLKIAADKKDPVYSCSDVSFTADRGAFNAQPAPQTGEYLSGESYDRKTTTKAMVEFMQGTQSKLEIENWLYIPLHRIAETLETLRSERVAIDVVTNDSCDVERARGVAKACQVRDNIQTEHVYGVSAGGSLQDSWAFTPLRTGWFVHSKVMIRDHRDVAVSSFNLDPRSYHTNLESSFFAKNCPSLAQALAREVAVSKASFIQDRNNPDVIDAEAQPTPLSMIDWLFTELL